MNKLLQGFILIVCSKRPDKKDQEVQDSAALSNGMYVFNTWVTDLHRVCLLLRYPHDVGDLSRSSPTANPEIQCVIFSGLFEKPLKTLKE
ncbi:hypothetical protein JOD18_004565 [Gracilibacillus alcaliphilus]|nr:hypothetical protein [Gracilibacillus alcaliphilus]